MNFKNIKTYVFFIAIFLLLYGFKIIFPEVNFVWKGEAFHSALEAAESFLAFLIAFILLLNRKTKKDMLFFWPAIGFINIGVINFFHSIVAPGNAFVALHSLAFFAGGVFFSLVLFEQFSVKCAQKKFLVPMFVVLAVVLSLLVINSPIKIFTMIDAQGEFTSLAVYFNVAAGVLFLIASLKFLQLFNRYQDSRFLRLVYCSYLFALGGLTFKYSIIWDDKWWLWHGLNGAAFIGMLLLIVEDYFSRNKIAQHLAKFPEENPDPVMRISKEGKIIYANKASDKVLEFWNVKRQQEVQEEIQDEIKRAFSEGKTIIVKETINSQKFSFYFTPVVGADYVNVYGREVTGIYLAQESLKAKVEELEKINKVMVGRELRMKELKREINILYEKLGMPKIEENKE